MTPRVIMGMRGFGDNMYQRAFVAALGGTKESLFIDTPWPELFTDLPVTCVQAKTGLRTQAKNVRSQPPGTFGVLPKVHRPLRVGYGARDLETGSLVGTMEKQFGVKPAGWSLPAGLPAPPWDSGGKPVAFLRPVTARKEWLNLARNPKPEYVADCAAWLRAHGWYVVSVADIQPGEEDLLGPEPEADVRFHAGELRTRALLGAMKAADLIIGGVGFIVPGAISAGTPLFCILGGHGAHNAPDVITHRSMDLRRVAWAMPRDFCRCRDMKHDCDKEIDNVTEDLARFVARLGV